MCSSDLGQAGLKFGDEVQTLHDIPDRRTGDGLGISQGQTKLVFDGLAQSGHGFGARGDDRGCVCMDGWDLAGSRHLLLLERKTLQARHGKSDLGGFLAVCRLNQPLQHGLAAEDRLGPDLGLGLGDLLPLLPPTVFVCPSLERGRGDADKRGLMARSDREVAAFLAARPDLVSPPSPSFTALAARAVGRSSVEAALTQCDAPALAVLFRSVSTTDRKSVV